MSKCNNGVFSKYIATEIALILVLALATLKEIDNAIVDKLFTCTLYILYHIIIFCSLYYGVRIIHCLREYNKKKVILFIGTFALNFILLLLTITGWLVEIFELS